MWPLILTNVLRPTKVWRGMNTWHGQNSKWWVASIIILSSLWWVAFIIASSSLCTLYGLLWIVIFAGHAFIKHLYSDTYVSLGVVPRICIMNMYAFIIIVSFNLLTNVVAKYGKPGRYAANLARDGQSCYLFCFISQY